MEKRYPDPTDWRRDWQQSSACDWQHPLPTFPSSTCRNFTQVSRLFCLSLSRSSTSSSSPNFCFSLPIDSYSSGWSVCRQQLTFPKYHIILLTYYFYAPHLSSSPHSFYLLLITIEPEATVFITLFLQSHSHEIRMFPGTQIPGTSPCMYNSSPRHVSLSNVYSVMVLHSVVYTLSSPLMASSASILLGMLP